MKLPVLGDLFEGRYLIESELGKGGFATVFQAVDTVAQRAVALKVARSSDGEYEVRNVARFLREARAVGGLQDRHTVTLYDVGRGTTGLLYLVCELVEGEDLSELLSRRSLTEPEAVQYLLQALSSLREAHAAGILHRDIKPGNIRIQRETGDVKVLDFGLAKSIDGEQSSLTATGLVVGTPRYMAPEQLLGTQLSPATDIYSLGATIFEGLVGREQMRPGAALKVPPGLVQPRLAAIIDKMVARDLVDRFRSADDVIRSLQALGEPARPEPARTVATPPAGPPPSTENAEIQSAHADKTAVPLGIIAAAVVLLAAWPLYRIINKEPARAPTRPVEVVARVLVDEDVGDEAPDVTAPRLRSEMHPCEVDPPAGGLKEVRVVKGLTEQRLPLYLPPGVEKGHRVPIVIYNRHWAPSNEPQPYELRLRELATSEKFALLPVKTDVDTHKLGAALYEVGREVCTDTQRMFFIGIGATHGREQTDKNGALIKNPRSNAAVANIAKGLCSRLAGFAAVNERLDPTVCPDAPFIHIAPTDDMSYPFRSGASADWDGLADSLIKQRRDCAGDERLFDDVLAGWRVVSDCSGRSTEFGEHCTLWECARPLAVCEAPGGARWTSSRNECPAPAPAKFDAEGRIVAFFGVAWRADRFTQIEYLTPGSQ